MARKKKWIGKLTKDLTSSGNALAGLGPNFKKGEIVVCHKKRELDSRTGYTTHTGNYEFHYSNLDGRGLVRTKEFLIESDMQNRTKQEYFNLLDETVKYYSEDTSRRGIKDGWDCEYFIEGRMCAVGRCINKPEKFQKKIDDAVYNDEINESNIKTVDKKFHINRYLKKEYRNFNIGFWNQLQRLHDSSHAWDPNGITPNGEKMVEDIKVWIDSNIAE